MGYRISAATDGFWRGGRQWHTTPVEVDIAEFTDAQWELLEADPAITIENMDPDDPGRPLGLGPLDPDATHLEEARERIVALEAANETLRTSLEDSRAHVDALVADKERLVAENVELLKEVEDLRQRLETPDAAPADGTTLEPEGGAASDGAPAAAEATREERIRAAIASLDPNDPEHFTKAGQPAVPALRALSGIPDVTGAERDAAVRDA